MKGYRSVDGSLQMVPQRGDEDDHHFNKDLKVKEYGAQMHTMKLVALFSTGLYSLNWFLGVCALTWASAVILGGLLTDLGGHDFYSVSALILLEALRLAAATFFGNLVTRKLIYRSPYPAVIKYNAKERHLVLAFLRILDQTFQLVVLAVSIFLPLKRLPSLPQNSSSDFDGLSHSLRIFYILVLLNAVIAVVGVLHSKTFVPLFTTTFSLRRYYDHVVWRGMEKGILYTTDFDFLAFAFKALADEYRRNLPAPVVYELYQDLIEYLYAHNRGFDVARIAMDSSDHCEQEAAANIVGLWAQIKGAGSSLLLQSRLLTKLADMLDHQETGRAATCSFENLAKCDAEGVLEVENERGERLMLILSKCIGRAVRGKEEDKALVFIKVLIQLLVSKAGRQEAEAMEERMVEDLKSVFRGRGCKKRTVGVAGKALMLMGKEPSKDEVEEWLRLPPCEVEAHILEDEKGYLLELLRQSSVPLLWQGALLRHNTWPRQSPSSTGSISCLVGLLSFMLIVLAVFLCLHNTNF